MSQSCPSALAPLINSYAFKSKRVSIVAENDIALKQLRKKGLYKPNSKVKAAPIQISCTVIEPSQKNLKILKQLLHKNLRKASIVFYSLSKSKAFFLGHYISQLSHLKQLKITLRTDEETDDGLLHKLSQPVSKIKNLKNFDLRLLEYNSITNMGIKELFQNISYISNLLSFGFQIYECETLNSENFTESVKYLTRLQSLKALKLDLTNCYELEDESLSGLTEVFSNLSSLTALNLNLKGCYNLTDVGLAAVSFSLNKLIQLKRLEINMDSCLEITEEGTNQFIQALGELRELAYLGIKFLDGPESSNKMLEILGETLLNLKNLKELEISLGSGQAGDRVCDVGISRLGELVAKLRGLRSLKMKLWAFKEFSDDGVEGLYKSLNKMELENLMLQFERCRGVTQRGINQLEKKFALGKRIPIVEIKCN